VAMVVSRGTRRAEDVARAKRMVDDGEEDSTISTFCGGV
jgi:hypothetical protein